MPKVSFRILTCKFSFWLCTNKIYTFKILSIILNDYVVCVCVGGGNMKSQKVTGELVLSFYLYVDWEDQAQAARLMRQVLYPLNHIASSKGIWFFENSVLMILLSNIYKVGKNDSQCFISSLCRDLTNFQQLKMLTKYKQQITFLYVRKMSPLTKLANSE